MPSSLIDVIRQHAPAPTDSWPAGREAYGLLTALARVPDPRDPRGVRYPLTSVLAVAGCAVMAGASTFAAIGDWVDDRDPPGNAAGKRSLWWRRCPPPTPNRLTCSNGPPGVAYRESALGP
ncbi:hypothetical protein GCM10022225_15230 [Plantactinospora mayteni]|uniref:transposase family protein n=1 Tax=Plantactinospora mayteni TaxID=566021 RepID=UPI001EF5F642|nr:transposase family protein [Plantactinospora mayteni]